MTNPTPTQSTKEMKNKHKIDDQSPSEKIARQEIKRLDDNLKAIKAIKSRISRIKPIECQKDMERVVKEEKKRLANEVRRILEEERKTMTGAYDVTTRAGKKRFRDMLRELVK